LRCFSTTCPNILCPLPVQPFAHLLPRSVVAPGAPVAPITQEAAERSGLPTSCMVCGGTTDSIAAFLAAGVTQPGEVRTTVVAWLKPVALPPLPNTSAPIAVHLAAPRLALVTLAGYHALAPC